MGRSRRRRTSGRANPRTRSGARGGASRGASRGGSRGVTITQMSPVGNVGGSRPTVTATVTDSAATLSKNDIRIHLDGEQVGDFQYRRTTGALSFTPGKLSSGAHTVEIQASAAEGSRGAKKSFSFVVS